MEHLRDRVRSFQDLVVWREAYGLALDIYAATRDFPKDEMYGITSQIRRAAVSTCANIAEGSKRRGTADLRHFLNIGQSSNEEVKCLLLFSRDLQYLPTARFDVLFSQCNRVGSLLFRLDKALAL